MNDPESAELPVACTLDGGSGRRRMARWRALAALGAPSVSREADALVVAYPDGPGVRDELDELAAAERECCSFADWDVESDADRVILRIRSEPAGLAAIGAIFGAD